ncbi:MAG TPA: hypothetical protein VFF58_00225 [Candidatus Nitrosotalea sp.]|nr:hypothetical protein [Candidatus Nitrosotalea sp.]
MSLFAILIATLSVPVVSARPSPPQAGDDAVFDQAVDAYQRNQFPQALAKFQQVSGAHAPEAQQYITKIKTYQEAMSVAKGIMDRSPDERDASSLQYAIQQYELATRIKPDGPWQPADQLARARELKAQVEKDHAERSKTMDSEFCNKALAAAAEHNYKQAADFACPLANDNPGYSCGGDEAVHMCQVDKDLAKIDRGAPNSQVTTGARSPNLDNARTAWDRNDFNRARTLFQRVDGDGKPAAAEFLDKIARYNAAIANAEKLSRGNQYDQARTAYLAAAAIKSDGPGDPQGRAAAMELLQGLDRFYSGDYAEAIRHLQACTSTATQKQPLVHFYLGASKLGRFFVTGSEDTNLHQDAFNDLKLAKQAGFTAAGKDVSPKILEAYKNLEN